MRILNIYIYVLFPLAGNGTRTDEQVSGPAADGAAAVHDLVLRERGREREGEADVAAVAAGVVGGGGGGFLLDHGVLYLFSF